MKRKITVAVFAWVVLFVCLWGEAFGQDSPPANTFTIESISPNPKDGKVSIVFDKAISWEVANDSVKLVPPVRINDWDKELQNQSKTLILHGKFKLGTKYLVSIPEGLECNGNKYRRTTAEFLMPDMSAEVRFAERFSLIERDSRQMVHTNLTNINEVVVETVRIPPIMMGLIHDPSKEFSRIPLDEILQVCKDKYAAIHSALQNEPDFQSFLSEISTDSQLFFTQCEKNKVIKYSAPLTFRKDKEKGAFDLVRIRDNRTEGKAFADVAKSEVRLFQITDLSISYKVSNKDLLVWVTSLRTGLPVPEASILGMDKKHKIFSLGKTDKQGLLAVEDGLKVGRVADVSKEKEVVVESLPLSTRTLEQVVAATADDCAFLTLRKDTLQTAPDPNMPASTRRAAIFTERGIYKPGETVHFKAVLREHIKDAIVTPKNPDCVVTIIDPKEQKVYDKHLRCSEFGTAADDLKLETYSKLGTYNLILATGGNVEIARATFQVQEFRPPRHYGEIAFKRETKTTNAYVNQERTEELLVTTIRGRYYAGGPVKHGKVRWNVYAVASDYPQSKYPEFEFGHPVDSEEDFIESGESILDESGEAKVTLPLSSAALAGTHAIKITGTVVDFDGRAASTSSTYQVEPEFLVGIASHPEGVHSGVPQLARIIVLNPKRHSVKNGEVEVKVYLRGYYYDDRRNEAGNVYWKWNDVWQEQYSTRLAIKDGEALFDFDFNWGGEYLVQCTYRDANDKAWTSGTTYSVEGPRYWWHEGSGSQERPYEQIQLIPDKQEYAEGDRIKLFIRANKPVAACLLTVERDRVFTKELIEVRNNQIDIPVLPSFGPNVYVSLLGTIPREDFPSYHGEYDIGAPSFVYGTTNVTIKEDVKSLQVRIGEGGDLKALPGQSTTLELHVSDEKGNGVTSELFVAVVDEQILALTRFVTPRLDDLGRFNLPLDVLTGEGRMDLQLQTPFSTFTNEPLTGGDGSEDGVGKKGMEVKFRKDFRPVAFYNPSVRTDEKGYASVTFQYPDTMTTYRVYVVACDAGSLFATAETKALVVKDFYLEPGLPNFLTRGDEFSFKVSAVNSTDAQGTVPLEIISSPELVFQAPIQSASIQAHDQILIPVEGKAVLPGNAHIFMNASLGEMKDGVQFDVPVYSGHVTDRQMISGVITGCATIGFTFPESLKDVSTEFWGARDLQVDLTLSGSPFLRMKPALSYLMNYPYGCIEQTGSRVLALASIRSLIQDGFIPGFTLGETDKFLKSGVDRLFSMQTSSGGFTYWPGSGKPSDWGTLYAMTALTLAKRAGMEMPGDGYTKGVEYLTKKLSDGLTGDWDRFMNDEWQDASYRGNCAYILANAGAFKREQFEQLERSYDRLGREGQLFYLMAAKTSKYLEDTDLAARVQLALAKQETEQKKAYHAQHRETAISLLCASQILGASKESQEQAASLISRMTHEGRWTSTSDTGWALMALGGHFRGATFPSKWVTGQAGLKGQTPGPAFTFDATASTTINLDGKAFLANPEVDVILDPSQSITYELSVIFPRLDYAKTGYSKGFKIQKNVKNTDGTETIRVGDVVKVELIIEPEGYDYRFMVLEDPLPAGFVAINPAIASEEPQRVDRSQGKDWYWRYWDNGYYNLMPNYLEMRDDRVLAFRDDMWSGEYKYSYYARAVCVGKFRMPATKVQLMYEPQTVAYTPESSVTIEDRK